MTEHHEIKQFTTDTTKYKFVKIAEPDEEWQCYLFGNKPGGAGIVYIPSKGQVPNWFVRWMMKVCLGCTWLRNKK